MLLARKARSLSPSVSISGWLFTTARLVSKDILRSEGRQRLTQEVAKSMQQSLAPEAPWDSIEPWLNDGLSHLSANDREALLLRYFEDMSLGEIAQATGATEPAARERVPRDRSAAPLPLKKEVAVTPLVLAALLSEHSAKAAPVDCQATTAHAMQGASAVHALPPLHPLIAKGVLIMSTTKLIAAACTATLVIAACTVAIVHRHNLSQAPPEVIQTAQSFFENAP